MGPPEKTKNNHRYMIRPTDLISNRISNTTIHPGWALMLPPMPLDPIGFWFPFSCYWTQVLAGRLELNLCIHSAFCRKVEPSAWPQTLPGKRGNRHVPDPPSLAPSA